MFAKDFEELAKSNTDFRRVLHTGQKAQLVTMCLPAGMDVGEETHETTDQIFLIAEGRGEAIVGEETHEIEEDSLIFVPAGAVHNLRNTGESDLRFLTIYAPPEHPDGTVHSTKEVARQHPEE